MRTAKAGTVAALVAACGVLIAVSSSTSAFAQQQESRLNRVTKTGVLRVCQTTSYYAVSYRNPKTDQLEGIDADLARELAKELGAKLEVVESNFATFIADLQADKCDIGMFGIAATLKRAQVVEFSKPYLLTSLYAIIRKDGKIKSWDDIDKPGVRIGAPLGSYTDTFMRSYFKQATLTSVAPPATIEGELAANRGDAMIGDYASAIRTKNEFDWAEVVAPDKPLRQTPYAYVMPQGDQVWLNYINLFIDTVKADGRLKAFAEKYHLGPILAP